MKRLTDAQYRALAEVKKGRVFSWPGGRFIAPPGTRRDVLLGAQRRDERRPAPGLRRSRPVTRVPYAADPHSGECWFAAIPGAGPCDGGLVRCHLIDKQTLRKEFPHGFEGRPFVVLQADPRSWVWGCGGPTGIGGHHGDFDGLKLRVPRLLVPLETEQMAEELGLEWWLDKTYGPIEEVA